MSLSSKECSIPNLEVPVVDFGSFIKGIADDRKIVATAIDASLCASGFVYISNHGIDQDKIDSCFQWVSSASFLWS